MSGVLVIAEHRRGELRPATLELVTAAQAARRDGAATITVAVIAQEPERLVAGVSVAGVDEVITVTNDILKKLSLVGKNLDDYSLETVKMFADDAIGAGFKL